jgi:hypothetical protein
MILGLSLQAIAYTPILGRPLILWAGLTTLILLISTATVGALNMRGITTIPLVWHFRLAKLTILLALAHGILGLLLYI